MTNPQCQSGDTSNDVLFRMDAIHPQPSLNYRIIAQSELEVHDVQNAPAISMSTFISETEQTQLLTRISIYSQRGESSEEIRLLYMNEVAYSTWKAMGKDPHVIGSQHRAAHNRFVNVWLYQLRARCQFCSLDKRRGTLRSDSTSIEY